LGTLCGFERIRYNHFFDGDARHGLLLEDYYGLSFDLCNLIRSRKLCLVLILLKSLLSIVALFSLNWVLNSSGCL
jgi:hypothetical protein